LLPIILVIILFFSIRNLNTIRTVIPFLPTPKTNIEPHPLQSDLTLTLSQVSTSPPTLRATVTNLHPTTSLTLLKWDTPFDDALFASASFSITDVATGATVAPVTPPDQSRSARRIAPADLLELGPRRAVTKDIALAGEGWALQRGREYRVRARGTAMVVWHAAVSAEAERALKVGGGPTGAVAWPFECEVGGFVA